MPAFTRLQLVTKLQELGHQYLPAARANEMIEEAAQSVILEELWPLRRVDEAVAIATGLPASGVEWGPILQVIETSVAGAPRVLAPLRGDELKERFQFSDSGPPRYYALSTGADRRKKITFFPTGVIACTVSHFSTAAWVTGGESASGDADITMWPRTHTPLLLARARFLAYEDIDDYEAAAQQEAKYQRRLDEARDQLLVEQWDEADMVRITQEMV